MKFNENITKEQFFELIPQDILKKVKKNEQFCSNWDSIGHTLKEDNLEYENKKTNCKFYICPECKFIIRTLSARNYEGYYEVSDNGRVISCDRKITKCFKGTFYFYPLYRKDLKLTTTWDNYQVITLNKNSIIKTCKVSILVAQAFIPNFLNVSDVNHMDGVKSNNNWFNLEWMTSGQNQKHAYEHGLKIPMRGEEGGTSKLTNKIVLKIRAEIEKNPVRGMQIRLAEKYNVIPQTISLIVLRKTWKHI